MLHRLTLLCSFLPCFGLFGQPAIYGSAGYSRVSGTSLTGLRGGYRAGVGFEHPTPDSSSYWGAEIQFHSYFPIHRHWESDSAGAQGYDLYIQQFQLVQVLGTAGLTVALNKRISLHPKLGLGFGVNRLRYQLKSGVYTAIEEDRIAPAIGFDASLRASYHISNGISAAFVVSYVSHFMRGIFLTAWQPSFMICWQLPQG